MPKAVAPVTEPAALAPAVPPPAVIGTAEVVAPVAPASPAPAEIAVGSPPPAATAATVDTGATLARPPDKALRLALRAPSRLPSQGSGTLALPIEARLSNISAAIARLSAPTPCDVATWQILDPRGSVILAKEADLCAQVVAESTLKPGETLISRDRIDIPGALLASGRYRLRYAFWGAVAEADITIQ
ncbi:hypothetical protein [Zavarzinia compransoris]|uniref:Uncharacterized protein n=1 Tax=Zavarzinia compransoris TaxID=1264899 RepID=A0A317E397_9PROT|nr:hypothetical protein [Zavarzinia compransoris]PWR19863.1 hypothetical protein DKG75_15520 [Zavarzinia compransoris]TDP45026.1 hypothetical protein DES42_106248 [Zavarzinia compransoris]